MSCRVSHRPEPTRRPCLLLPSLISIPLPRGQIRIGRDRDRERTSGANQEISFHLLSFPFLSSRIAQRARSFPSHTALDRRSEMGIWKGRRGDLCGLGWGGIGLCVYFFLEHDSSSRSLGGGEGEGGEDRGALGVLRCIR